jgi:5'-3' exonuclease
MGIPYYFRQLIKQHPGTIYRYSKSLKCDRLFLDFNSIIHQCASLVTAKATFTDKDAMYHEIIQSSLNFTKYLFDLVQPSQLFYVAVDGLCPRAKMQQQRKRRYMAAWQRQYQQAISSDNTQWDSNTVTPGTRFMKLLDEKLAIFCLQLQKIKKTEIKVSGSNEFGEGEFKIFDLMRKSDTKYVNVVYGLDADLILLSLLESHSQHIFLLRESLEFNGLTTMDKSLSILDITAVHKCLTSVLQKDAIEDYVFLVTLVGNDFLPALSYLKIKDQGIDLIIQSYLQEKCNIVTEKGINVHNLTKVICNLMNNEGKHLEDSQSRTENMHGSRQELKINFNSKTWRFDWYHHLFNGHSPELISQSCQGYLEGLAWIYNYYFKKIVDCQWYYKFCYSPTIYDLYNFMQHNHSIFESLDTSRNQTIDASLHLLMVLPPQSKDLLDENIQCIMTDLKYGLCHLYPYRSKLQTYLKSAIWEHEVLLPDINLDELTTVYQEYMMHQSK